MDKVRGNDNAEANGGQCKVQVATILYFIVYIVKVKLYEVKIKTRNTFIGVY